MSIELVEHSCKMEVNIEEMSPLDAYVFLKDSGNFRIQDDKIILDQSGKDCPLDTKKLDHNQLFRKAHKFLNDPNRIVFAGNGDSQWKAALDNLAEPIQAISDALNDGQYQEPSSLPSLAKLHLPDIVGVITAEVKPGDRRIVEAKIEGSTWERCIKNVKLDNKGSSSSRIYRNDNGEDFVVTTNTTRGMKLARESRKWGDEQYIEIENPLANGLVEKTSCKLKP